MTAEQNIVIDTVHMTVIGNYMDVETASRVGDSRDEDYFIAGEPEHLKRFGGNELVRLYNGLTGKDLSRFRDKDTAVSRSWEAILDRFPQQDANVPESAPETTEAAPRVASKKSKSKSGVKRKNIAGQGGKVDILPKPLGQQKSCLAGSKQAILLDCLSDNSGITMYELEAQLSQNGKPWTVQTIQSGFSWDMKSVKGYGVRTEFHNGEWLWNNGHEAEAGGLHYEGGAEENYDPETVVAVYFLRLPEGMDKPLPHRQSKKKKD